MTPTLYIKYQAIRTLSSPRRLVVLTFLMLLIAFSGLLVLFQNAPNAVTFNGDAIPVIRPAEAEVCIGGKLYFATLTETTNDEIPGRIEIDEVWCLEGLDGACKTVPPPNPRFPLLEPKRIVTPRVSRDVPVILTPGVYHFWHTATDTRGNVTGYIVAPITVKYCEVP